MTTSEPTTGEITTRLYAWIAKAGYQDRCRDELIAINRLESQEREIAELTVACETIHQEKQAMIDCHKPNLDKIAALTDRAEQAEAREKAAIREIERNCTTCGRKLGFDTKQGIFICALPIPCQDANEREKWKWRGQPQDGEGK